MKNGKLLRQIIKNFLISVMQLKHANNDVNKLLKRYVQNAITHPKYTSPDSKPRYFVNMVSQEVKRIFSDISMISQIFVCICGVILHSLLLYAFGRDPLKCFKKLSINLAIADFLVCFISPFRFL